MERFSQDDVLMTEELFNPSYDLLSNSSIAQRSDFGDSSSQFEHHPNLKSNDSGALFDCNFPSLFDVAAFSAYPHLLGQLESLREAQSLMENARTSSILAIESNDVDAHVQSRTFLDSSSFEPELAQPRSGIFRGFSPIRGATSEDRSAPSPEQSSVTSNSDSFSHSAKDLTLGKGKSSLFAGNLDNTKDDPSTMTDAIDQDTNKAPKKRGRKRSSLSPEERRTRHLERGRMAANRCRKKKRKMEGELESKANWLLLEREGMLKTNDILQNQVRELQLEISKHTKSDCNGCAGVGKISPNKTMDEHINMPLNGIVAQGSLSSLKSYS